MKYLQKKKDKSNNLTSILHYKTDSKLYKQQRSFVSNDIFWKLYDDLVIPLRTSTDSRVFFSLHKFLIPSKK